MATQIQRRRGTTAEHSVFTGAAGELTVDTTKKTVVVHDGITAGGQALSKEGHTHTTGDITGFQSALDTRAALSGATFTGTVTAPNFVSSSDVRLKSEIAPITEALAKVQTLQGVTFRMVGSDTRQIGLIAQDVRAVAPEAVVEADGVLRLAYGNLVGLLVEAIKDLEREVAQLKRTTP